MPYGSTKSCAVPCMETNSPAPLALEKPFALLNFIYMLTWLLITMTYITVNSLVLLFHFQNVPGLIWGGCLPQL